MKFQEIINKRHSIREFEKKKVPIPILKRLIKNATEAPSACNRQPWIFYCINNKKKRDEISKLLLGAFKRLWKETEVKNKKIQKIANNFYKDMGGAQNIIFVYRKKSRNEAPHVRPNDMLSIACAIENLMLCSVEKGLGTCWIGTFKGGKIEKELGRILKIKEEELIGSIVIGYPKKGYKPLIRRKKKLNEVLKFI